MKLTQRLYGWMMIGCAAILILFGGWARAAGIPPLINYQGVLTTPAGANVPDASYPVVFSIYAVPTGGTALWSESWPAVQTFSGNFSVMMGAITPIASTFFSQNPTTYLGIKAGSDAEMLPRQRMGAVAYAFHAGNADNGSSAPATGGNIPTGGIIMWSGAIGQIPAGWALCNGSGGTPDLRDRFIVGAGSGYSVGATGGTAMHVLTVAEMPSHTHVQNAHTHTQDAHSHGLVTAGGDTTSSGVLPNRAGPGTVDQNTEMTAATNQNTTAINQSTGGGAPHENRPPYYALAFIMKL